MTTKFVNTDAAPVAAQTQLKPRKVERTSDFSVELRFASCREASEFERKYQQVDRSTEMQRNLVDETPNLQGQQQPVSGADGLTDAAIEMLAKQYDCHNAPGFKGFARAVAALAQQDDDGHCRSCQGDFCTAGAECVAMEDTQAPRVVQLTHSKHGTMQINTSILREVANREAGEGTFIDAAGTVWSRPTAYAYAMVCKARDKWQAKAEEARDSALGEAAQALAYRRNLLISQNIVIDIQEGVALYDICIDAVLSLQQNATSTSPDKPKRATPMGELVLQLFDALDEAMRLDKSPTAWKHNPAGTPAQRMEAWQKVHKLRAEIKEFMP